MRTILLAAAFACTLTAPLRAADVPAPVPVPVQMPATHFNLKRPEIRSFIAEQAKAGASARQLRSLLSNAVPQPKIIEIMTRPAEKALQWYEYRARFMSDERIDAGVALWREHREQLEAIARRDQVPPQYILAILGVETFYGRNTGRYRVLDALATLAFDYPPRSAYFRSELGQFLKLCKEEHLDARTLQGSYAGAMGVAQFMPSSYRQYAVNEDGSSVRDLWNDWGDIFGSVAHYLHQFGWQYGGRVLAEARYTRDGTPDIPAAVSLTDTLGGLRQRGFEIQTDAADDTPALVVAAPLAESPGYRVGFKNFYVITRYNRSPLYAMVVSDLADAINSRFKP